VGGVWGIDKGGYTVVGGTGTLAAGTLSVRNGGIFDGTLFVGAVSGAPTNYARTDNLVLISGAKVRGDAYLSSTAKVTMQINGSTDGGADALIELGNLTGALGAVLTIDLSGFTINAEDTISLASYLSGLNLDDIAVEFIGYDQSAWIVKELWNSGTLSMLIVIPEPALGGALLGLLALMLAVRRRK